MTHTAWGKVIAKRSAAFKSLASRPLTFSQNPLDSRGQVWQDRETMKNFSPYNPPYFHETLPDKTLYVKGKVHGSFSNYAVIELNGHKYEIEMSGGGDDERELYVTELLPKDNSEYNKQYQRFSNRKRAFEVALTEWKEQKAIWDKEQAAEQERQEKTLYRKLKAKFKDKE